MQSSPRPAPDPTAPPVGFDAARLGRLLDLVGPDQAPALLTQLRIDLAACGEQISAARPGPDWNALRDASHVLISLAGSVGATGLHGMAQDLNATAHARDAAALARLLPALSTDLAALIALIADMPAGGRP